jgi:hypothetical protein
MRDLRWSFVVVCLALLALPGCSLFQTHIDVPDARAVQPDPWAGDLGSAIDQASRLRQRYHDAVSAQSLARNGMATTLIPLSAAALAVGIASPATTGTRNFLIASGAGGAATYGVGSFLIDRTRERVYLTGEKAVTCAILAMRPALVTNQEYVNRTSQVQRLVRAAAGAEAAAVKPALLSQARTTLSAAQALLARIGSSGFTLSQQLYVINADVSDQLLQNEPDLNAILTVVGGLGAKGGAFAPGFPARPGGAGQQQGGQRLTLESNAETELRTAMESVAPWLTDAAALDKAMREVGTCTPASVAPPRLAVASDVVDAAPGTVINIPVQTPGVPRAAVAGATGVTAAAQVVNGQMVVQVTVARDATAGDRTLIVTDPASGGETQLLIRVGGTVAQPGPTIPPPPPVRPPAKPADAGGDTAVQLSDVQFRQIRARMGLTAASAPNQNDPIFVDAVKLIQRCLAKAQTGRFTQQQLDDVLPANSKCLGGASESTNPPGAATAPSGTPGATLPPPPSPR